MEKIQLYFYLQKWRNINKRNSYKIDLNYIFLDDIRFPQRNFLQ